jgi:hypothetical protein
MRYPYCARCYHRLVVEPRRRAKDIIATAIEEVIMQQSAPSEEIAAMPESPIEAPPPHRGGRRPKNPLSPEVKSEIADAYRLGQPTPEILRAYNINHAVLYAIIHQRGIPLRSRANGKAAEPEPEPEPDLQGPATDKARWVVTFEVRRTEQVATVARTFAEAVRQVEVPDGAEIIRVERR